MALLKNPISVYYRQNNFGVVGQSQWFGLGGRKQVSPTNRHNSFQGEYKILFQRIRRAWLDLSNSDKDLWRAFSVAELVENRYGDMIEIGGWQWFVKLNSVVLQSGQSIISMPPANSSPTYNPTIAPIQEEPSKNILAIPSPSPTGGQSFNIRRSLNRPYSETQPTNSFRTFRVATSGDSFPLLIASSSELLPDPQRHKFEFHAADEFGRQSSLIYDDVVLPTTP